MLKTAGEAFDIGKKTKKKADEDISNKGYEKFRAGVRAGIQDSSLVFAYRSDEDEENGEQKISFEKFHEAAEDSASLLKKEQDSNKTSEDVELLFEAVAKLIKNISVVEKRIDELVAKNNVLSLAVATLCSDMPLNSDTNGLFVQHADASVYRLGLGYKVDTSIAFDAEAFKNQVMAAAVVTNTTGILTDEHMQDVHSMLFGDGDISVEPGKIAQKVADLVYSGRGKIIAKTSAEIAEMLIAYWLIIPTAHYFATHPRIAT